MNDLDQGRWKPDPQSYSFCATIFFFTLVEFAVAIGGQKVWGMFS